MMEASQVVLVVKNLPANARVTGAVGLILGLGRSPGAGNGNPLQCSCLENPQGQRSLAGYSPKGCTLGCAVPCPRGLHLGFPTLG